MGMGYHATAVETFSVGFHMIKKDRIRDLARSWISFQSAEPNSPSYDELVSESHELWRMGRRSPCDCLDVLLEIINSSDSDFILSNLAAGPLEDLLVKNGNTVIGKIEEISKSNHGLKRALKMVWRQDIAEDLWGRIQACSI